MDREVVMDIRGLVRRYGEFVAVDGGVSGLPGRGFWPFGS